MNNPFTLLPANLAAVASAAGSPTWLYTLSGVRVALRGDEYEVAATDGKQLAVVTGRNPADPLAFPEVPELIELPPSGDGALVPAAEWQRAFRSAPKKGGPGAGQVAVHLGKGEVVLCTTTDGEDAQLTRTAPMEGRFPDYQAVLPKGEPKVRLSFDPALLLNLLKVAAQFTGDEDPATARVTLELHGGNQPMVVRAGNGEQQFVGLVMPLAAE